MRISRRRFLFYAIGFVALLFTSLIPQVAFSQLVKKVIKRDVSKLHVKEADIDKFIREAEHELYFLRFDYWDRLFIAISYTFDSFGLPFPYHLKYLQFKSRITGRFLLSTDFFQRKMDYQAQITYIQFYNPYNHACFNPLPGLAG